MITLFDKPIPKPDQDKCQYAYLTLDNQLLALAIHDPEADKAAAALDVHIGHLCDPEETPGLAHFCEHLLFMGTEKYPEENDYNDYLAAHGGRSNAFTGAEHTNYFFEVAADHLEGALDRFAQFFICPLFSDSCTERELNAVDSEHKKNIQVDGWRVYQLEKDLSDPNHPYHKFGTGNLQTLKDEPSSKGLVIRDVLLDFHSKYYSSNIMGLVVIGKEPISTLTEWITEKFSAVKNKSVSVPVFPWHPLTENQLDREILIKPVKQLRHLSLIFPFPDLRDKYKTKPSSCLSHLIGHEGKGSILSLLKQKGLAQNLSAGPSGGSKGFDFFRVSIELTEAGVASYKEIIKIVFEYIQLLRTTHIDDYIFKECQALQKIAFKFKEKGSSSGYASQLATNLHLYEPQDILSGPYIIEKFDRDATLECLKYLTPESFRYSLSSPAFTPNQDWLKAQHYGTDYKINAMPVDLRESLKSVGTHSALHLPLPNSFIPEDFDIVGDKTGMNEPKVLVDTSLLRLWHKTDNSFLVPKANVFFQLRTPLAYESPQSCVLTTLFVELLRDELNELAYEAAVAGLQYRVDNNIEGIILSVHGYNHKLAQLLEFFVQKATDLYATESTFNRIKEMTRKTWRNWFQEAPHAHAMYYLGYVTQEKLITTEEKLAALEPITLQDVVSFSKTLLSSLFIEGLVHGNISTNQAIEMSDIVLKALHPNEIPGSQRFCSSQTYKIPSGHDIIYTHSVHNPNNVNSAIEYALQLGPVSDNKLRAVVSLLAQIAQEPAFDQLRTKEQLGYIVWSGVRKQVELISYRIIIQSEKHPVFLFKRIEAFLIQFGQTIQEMDTERFEKHKQALIVKILEKIKNLGQESQRLWSHISSYDYFFEQNEHDAELIKAVTKEELLAFYREYIAPSSSTRRLLSIHLVSQKVAEMEPIPERDANLPKPITMLLTGQDQVQQFRSTLSLSGQPSPVHPISRYLPGST